MEALRDALRSGHLAAPRSTSSRASRTPTNAEFDVGFADLPNVILTPHVGGNTEEAQRDIGLEVANSFIGFVDAARPRGR